MTTMQIAAAIQRFAVNLDLSITMEERRDAVAYLAEDIGSESAQGKGQQKGDQLGHITDFRRNRLR